LLHQGALTFSIIDEQASDTEMGQFGAAVSAMDVSAMKCEIHFPLECHQNAKFHPAVVKRVGARFGLALVPIVQQ